MVRPADSTGNNQTLYQNLLKEQTTLNSGTDDHLEVTGYQDVRWKVLLYNVCSVLTLGILVLIVYWKPEWKVYLTKAKCPLSFSDTVFLKDQYGNISLEEVMCFDEDGVRMRTRQYHYFPSAEDLHEAGIEDDRVALLIKQDGMFRYFDHHFVRYVWEAESYIFRRLRGLDEGVRCSEFLQDSGLALSSREQQERIRIYGRNTIEIEVKSYGKLFFEEVLNPFYIFQIASIILWMNDNYYFYASCIFLISAISMGISLWETRTQSETLRDMVSSTDRSSVHVVREDGEEEVSTHDLVPGDVIVIPQNGCIMHCDAVLVSGNCIVNESMLTGESVPVTKTPLSHGEDQELYSPDLHKRHTLFCGTHVIQTRYYGHSKVHAIVVRTGFATAKGELVRSILFPKPLGFQFYQDSMKFIGVLACIATLGMVYAVTMLIYYGTRMEKVILRALDIITIVVPPALPAAMTVGTVYAQNRLKKRDIFCISPPRINVCGKIKLVCFDKTGTLTEDGLDMFGVVPTQEPANFQPLITTPSLLGRTPLIVTMATCHSLTRIGGEITGDPLDLKMFESTNWIMEEPGADTEMFDSLAPTVFYPKEGHGIDPDLDIFAEVLEEPGSDTAKFDTVAPTVVKPCTKDTFTSSDEPPFEVGIIRQFPFSSVLQRMSVVARTLGADHMDLYAKGAPEKIAAMCVRDTLPEDFHVALQKYTMQGFRVIAVAWKSLDPKLTWHQVQRIQRDKVESELRFLGLIIMQNALKPQTAPVIRELQDANIRTVMVTGDNILTALSVARDCGMVLKHERIILVHGHPGTEDGKLPYLEWEKADFGAEDDERASLRDESYQIVDVDDITSGRYHFAMNGRTFGIVRQYFPELVQRLCVRGTVFARMAPDQKTHLVEHLQELGYIVGMCGDGANDCGALKMAHAGISLSEAEASVASPFTSKNPNIECVPTVIREGRAALTTSFGVFKYMALYSIIQFISVLMLYTLRTNLSDTQFLYIDLAITTTVAILMGHTDAYERLVALRPPGSLVGAVNILSIVVQILIQVVIQAGAYFYLTMQEWYVPMRGSPGADYVVCWETFIIFCVSSFQYLIMAYVYSRGPPFRKPVYTNVPFLVSLIILTGFTVLLLLSPWRGFNSFFGLLPNTDEFMSFKLTLLGFPVANFLLCSLVESFLIDGGCLKKVVRLFHPKPHPKNKYKLVEHELVADFAWPPVGDSTFAQPDLGRLNSGFVS